MDMRYTKIILKNILGILALIAALIAAIATIGGSYMNTLIGSRCPVLTIQCAAETYILFITLIVGGILVIVFLIPIMADLLIASYKKFWPRIVDFFKTPNPKNIYIYLESNYPRRKNEIVLVIENDEWRLNPSLAFADVLLLRAYPNDAEEKVRWKDYNPLDKWEHLKWINTGNSNAIEIRGFQSKELEFMKIDTSTKEFCVDTDVQNQTKLKAGTYQFIIKVIMRETRLHIRNNFPSTFRLNRSFSITIKYDGSNIVIEDKRDATDDESRY